jgi:hypothetical protein
MTDRSILIHARAGTVYPLIADPIRMAEWSPECVRCRWVGGARRAEVGARFRGTGDRSGGRPAWPHAPDVVASHHWFTGSAPPQRRHDGDDPGRHQGSRRGTRSLTPAGRNRPAQGVCQRRAVHCEA